MYSHTPSTKKPSRFFFESIKQTTSNYDKISKNEDYKHDQLDEEVSEEEKEMDSFSDDDDRNDRRISTAEDSRKNSKDLRNKANNNSQQDGSPISQLFKTANDSLFNVQNQAMQDLSSPSPLLKPESK